MVRFPDGHVEDVAGDHLNTVTTIQTRLPFETVQRIVHCPPSLMKTSTRFYTINKYDDKGNPKCVLLDQNALVCALRTVCPTMSITCAYAVSLNVLVRLGVNADINGDGYISHEEWAALDDILKSQERAAGASSANQKRRLISLMLF